MTDQSGKYSICFYALKVLNEYLNYEMSQNSTTVMSFFLSHTHTNIHTYTQFISKSSFPQAGVGVSSLPFCGVSVMGLCMGKAAVRALG